MYKLFDTNYLNNKVFSVSEYNDKKNIQLKSCLTNLDCSKVDELYSLLEQYKQSKVNKNLLSLLYFSHISN